MIDWTKVDAVMVLWALFNAVILTGIICLSVYLVRLRRRNKRQYVINAIARYDNRTKSRGAVSALVDKI